MWTAYRLRWKRRRLLLRGWRSRGQLTTVCDRTAHIGPGTILAAATVRNESARLPYFLEHHRELGVGHFLIVDNDSTDGTAAFLLDQPDVSVWHTAHSYRQARFGMDWLTHLLGRYAHGHWTLTVDADELLVIPHTRSKTLRDLTTWLDAHGAPAMFCLMIDLFPKGPPSAQHHSPGQDPTEVLPWFDAVPHSGVVQPKLQNLWVQGGLRARHFFAKDPARAPTLNKLPLVKWDRRFVYYNSTHTILPRRLNRLYLRQDLPTGALLHTKFLPQVVAKSAEDRNRKEHFNNFAQYQSYYDSIITDADLWHEGALRYSDWEQLVALRLMTQGDWR